jgi:biotin carboxyl carrier protein
MSQLRVTIDGQPFEVELALTPQCGQVCRATVNGREVTVTLPDLGEPGTALEWMIIDGRPYELSFDQELNWVKDYSGLHRVAIEDQQAKASRPAGGDGRIKAPIPGLIARVLVGEGAQVAMDQTLFILEAMKMENEIRAPFDGVVRAMAVQAGQTVAQDDVLLTIAAASVKSGS